MLRTRGRSLGHPVARPSGSWSRSRCGRRPAEPDRQEYARAVPGPGRASAQRREETGGAVRPKPAPWHWRSDGCCRDRARDCGPDTLPVAPETTAACPGRHHRCLPPRSRRSAVVKSGRAPRRGPIPPARGRSSPQSVRPTTPVALHRPEQATPSPIHGDERPTKAQLPTEQTNRPECPDGMAPGRPAKAHCAQNPRPRHTPRAAATEPGPAAAPADWREGHAPSAR